MRVGKILQSDRLREVLLYVDRRHSQVDTISLSLSLSKCLDYLYHSYMLQDTQVLGNDHNKPHSLMSDPISTMYFHNMSCDLLNKILFKPSRYHLHLVV